VNQNLTGSVSR